MDKKNKDDLIAEAVNLGLGEGVDLTKKTKAELQEMIDSLGVAPEASDSTEVHTASDLDGNPIAFKAGSPEVPETPEDLKTIKFSDIYPKDFCDLAEKMYGDKIDNLSEERVTVWVEKVYREETGKEVVKKV